ncbi:hypothetical protein [Pseudaquabacterium pictum]|uniref:Uncharacterized protein n=1 Tax=Pseudaquabacterium pictum TaxID=2315236 RepID=A0A480AKD4_9BURK|nr:hypothetical protein [Rubrivivax pictus]GCL61180.1 hypothetical protein AQPW35_02610 [Rubrivivax pictus]
MAFVPTLRRVLANLREGLPAEAVRTGEPVPASAAYRQRVQAQAATDAWLQTLLPTVPAHLHAALQQCTALHEDAPPITCLPALLETVTQKRHSLQAVLDRGDMPATAADLALLGHLSELLTRLPQLAEPGGAGGIPPGIR